MLRYGQRLHKLDTESIAVDFKLIIESHTNGFCGMEVENWTEL